MYQLQPKQQSHKATTPLYSPLVLHREYMVASPAIELQTDPVIVN